MTRRWLVASLRACSTSDPFDAVGLRAPVTLPHSEVGAPILQVDRRPTQQEWEALNRALPHQPLHLALAVCGHRDRAGWWGEGRKAGWSDVLETAREVAGSALSGIAASV